MIKLATVFSGIGAIEQALKRLGVPFQIVFACDNGDVELQLLNDDDQATYKRLVKLRSKKQLKREEDIKLLNCLSQKEVAIAEDVLSQVAALPTKGAKKLLVDKLYSKNSRQTNFVKKSYKANYDIAEEDYHLDIRFLDGSDYLEKRIDLLVGGSPCQSFSTVGAQHGLQDTRGTLFYDFARIIKQTQPRAFIYENVRGLTTHDDGRTWATMKRVFEEDLSYKIADPQILNASDFGIPQTRRRVFVVGIRKDIECSEFAYPTPVELKFTMQDFLEDNCAYGNFRFNCKDGGIIVKKVPGKPNTKFTLTPAVQKYVLAGGTGNYKTSTITDLPIARTLMKMMTQHHRAGVDNYITVQENPLVLRQLSDREALRLMGYPDSFKIEVSSMQILRQAGNSIVVDVIMAIVKQLFKTGVFQSTL